MEEDEEKYKMWAKDETKLLKYSCKSSTGYYLLLCCFEFYLKFSKFDIIFKRSKLASCI